MDKVVAFLELVQNTTQTFAKFLKQRESGYFFCLKKNFPIPVGSLMVESFGKNFNFEKAYLCQVNVRDWILPIAKNSKLITFLTQFWKEILRKGYISRQWDNVNYYESGLGCGAIISMLVRRFCKLKFKKNLLKKGK